MSENREPREPETVDNPASVPVEAGADDPAASPAAETADPTAEAIAPPETTSCDDVEPVAEEPAAAATTPAAEGTEDREPESLMKSVIEAVLFAADKPVTPRHLAQLSEDLDVRLVRRIIDDLRREYDEQGRAFQIEEIADGYQMLTRPEYREWVASLRRAKIDARLSEAAVETLAIVAYKQPVTRAQVEDIRGVQTGPLLRTLMERRLVKITGRKEVPGRPLLYGTTREFLEHFGLKSLDDLPTSRDLPHVT